MEEELDIIEKTSKGVPVWAKTIVFLLVGFMVSYSFYKNLVMEFAPELFERKIESAVIHNDFQVWSDSMEIVLRGKFEDELKTAKIEHKNLDIKNKNLAEKILEMEKQITILQEGISRQVEFNTHNISITSEAVWELLNNDSDCKNVRYSRSKVDRYILWDEDWYSHPTLQRITAGSGCRVTINPFERERIRMQYERR